MRFYPKFLLSPQGGVLVGIALLFGLTFAAAAGFVLIEEWPLSEALFMAIITISTVGYGEVQPLSDAGRVFTSIVIVSGIVIVAYTTTKLGQAVLEAELFGKLGRRRMRRELDRVSEHYIVCGFGRVGKPVAEGLLEAGNPVCVVDENDDLEDELASEGLLYVIGDATEEESLLDAGVERAQAVLALLPSDADNVYLTITAKGLRREVYVIARASEEKAEAKLTRGGADKVISPYSIAGTRVLEAALRPTVVEFMELATHREHLALNLEELTVNEGSMLDGCSIAEAHIRRRLGVMIVAVKRPDGQMIFNPEPSERLNQGDILVAIGPRDALAKIEKACQG